MGRTSQKVREIEAIVYGQNEIVIWNSSKIRAGKIRFVIVIIWPKRI